MITSPALWETSNDGEAAQGTQRGRGGFSIGPGDLLNLSFFSFLEIIWFGIFPLQNPGLLSEIQKILKIRKKKVFFFFCSSPKKNMLVYFLTVLCLRLWMIVILVLYLPSYMPICLSNLIIWLFLVFLNVIYLVGFTFVLPNQHDKTHF